VPALKERRYNGGIFSVALSVGTPPGVASRVYPSNAELGTRNAEKSPRFVTNSALESYAASRPMVFGLSSPGSRRKRFSAFPKPGEEYLKAGVKTSGLLKRIFP